MKDQDDLLGAVRLLNGLDAVIVDLRRSAWCIVTVVQLHSGRRCLGVGTSIADAVTNAIANGLAIARRTA